MDFADSVARIRDALSRPGPWDVSRPLRPHVSAELAGRREAGRVAYERALKARGVPVAQVRVYASALPWLYGGD